MSTPSSYSPLVQSALSKMTDEQKKIFEAEYARRRKNTALYVVLAIIFPIQLVLLNRLGLQLAFWFTVGGLGVWYVIESFKTPGRVREYNDDVAKEIARDLSIMT